MDNETLLSACDRYCALTGLKPSTVGTRIMNDGKFFARLARGGCCSTRNAKKVMDWFAANTPEHPSKSAAA